jgi:pimeloyl-ACP methyl ester carboxylesterase
MSREPARPSRRVRRTLIPWWQLVTLIIVTALVAALPSAAPASAPTTSAHSVSITAAQAKPTIVLVHGAWADGSGWAKVVSGLERQGYPVRVPPNPLRSLAGDSATIADFISTIPGPIVLVGHSYGGAVITNAATNDPEVRALVYVDAFAPDHGETIFPLSGADSALAVDPTTVFDFVPYPGAPAGDVDLYLQHDVFLTSFANGVPRPQAEVLYATQRPLTFSAGNQPSGVPAWKTIPSWYLLGTRDKIITPSAQLFMAQRAGSTIVRVKAGHLGLVTHPRAVTRLIVRAVHATD